VLIDSFNRKITCLRISVTDRCNLRCVYCSPEHPDNTVRKNPLLTIEEIKKIVEAATEVGINTVRITGGEPLLRSDLDQIIGVVSKIPGIQDVGITTNGVLLEKYATRLAQAGLKRVNISLDTLDPIKFKSITRIGNFNKTWNGIQAVEASGMKPIKINSVIMRGINDDELESLASLTIHNPWHIRFIEFMSLIDQSGYDNSKSDQQTKYISMHEMIERLSGLKIKPAEKIPGTCPVITYRIPGAEGTIGFIAPIGKKFCENCNRLRLTADGFIRTCLLNDIEIYLRDSLDSKEKIIRQLEFAAKSKPEGHRLEHGQIPGKRNMQQIGG
jgi:cyclic pyranopterin phosphate synthase